MDPPPRGMGVGRELVGGIEGKAPNALENPPPPFCFLCVGHSVAGLSGGQGDAARRPQGSRGLEDRGIPADWPPKGKRPVRRPGMWCAPACAYNPWLTGEGAEGGGGVQAE